MKYTVNKYTVYKNGSNTLSITLPHGRKTIPFIKFKLNPNCYKLLTMLDFCAFHKNYYLHSMLRIAFRLMFSSRTTKEAV